MLRQVLPHQVDLCHSLTRLCLYPGEDSSTFVLWIFTSCDAGGRPPGESHSSSSKVSKDNRPRNMDVILLADKSKSSLFQRYGGLPETGVVDGATEELMARPRFRSIQIKQCKNLCGLGHAFFGADVEWRISIKGEGVSPKTLTAILDSLLVILFKAANGRKED